MTQAVHKSGANVCCRHVANDMLVAAKVRYSWNLSAAPHLGERPESARSRQISRNTRRSDGHPIELFTSVVVKGPSPCACCWATNPISISCATLHRRFAERTPRA
jgi:hypothetical protein